MRIAALFALVLPSATSLAQYQGNDQPIAPPPPAYQAPPSAQYQQPYVPPQQPAYSPPAYQAPAPAYQPAQPVQGYPPSYGQQQQPVYEPPPPVYQAPQQAAPSYGQQQYAPPPPAHAPAAAIAPPDTSIQKANWYLPIDSDKELAWNSHNPWSNDSMNAYLLQGFDSFVWAMTGNTQSLGQYWSNLWLETGVGFRFKGGFGLDLGAITAPGITPTSGGALFFGGFEVGGQGGVMLHDWSSSDVQIGLLFPDFFMRVIAPPSGGNAAGELGCSGLTGVRVTIEDIVQIELRVPSLIVVGTVVGGAPIGGGFSDGQQVLAALQVGGRISAGVVF